MKGNSIGTTHGSLLAKYKRYGIPYISLVYRIPFGVEETDRWLASRKVNLMHTDDAKSSTNQRTVETNSDITG